MNEKVNENVDRAHSATCGLYAHSATSGDHANSATTGAYADSATCGYGAHSATCGYDAVACALGSGSMVRSASGPLVGTWHDGQRRRVAVAYPGEAGILPNTWYRVDDDGHFSAL